MNRTLVAASAIPADRWVSRVSVGVFVLALQVSLMGPAPQARAQSSFDTADEYFEDAIGRISAGEDAAAIIQLRNALQIKADHIPSMLALGKELLKTGEASEAALVLSDALLLGAEPAQVIPFLADAYLSAEAYAELLRNFIPSNVPRSLRAEVYAARAQALLAQGRTVPGGVTLESAKAIDPTNYRAAVAEVAYLLQQAELGEALRVSSRLIESFPKDTRSWSSHASVLHAQGRLDEAAEAYREAIRAEEGNVDARLALIDLHMERRQDTPALPHIEYLRENYPNDPRAAYYSALHAARSGDPEKESEELSLAVSLFAALDESRIETNPKLLMLAALSSYGAGSYEAAASYIEAYLGQQPDDPGAIRLKASTLMALGDTGNTIRTLLPQYQRNPRDPATASILASAYSEEGNFQRSEEILLAISEAGYDSESLKLQLAMTRLNAGALNEGIADLEDLRERNPEQSNLNVQLVVAYLRNNQATKALALLDELPQALTDSSSVRNLRAVTLASLGEQSAAESLWLDLLRSSPESVGVMLNVATSLIESGRYAEARAMLDLAIAADAESSLALAMSAKLSMRMKDPESALRDAEKALNLDGDNEEAAWQNVRALLTLERPDEALEYARSFSSRRPASMPAAAILGQTYEFVGQPAQARLVYAQMARRPETNAADLFRIAELQRGAGGTESAALALAVALEKDPNYRAARLELASVLMELEQYEDAETTATEQLALTPDDPVSWILLGEACWAQEQFEAAIAAFEQAVSRGAVAPGSLGLYRSHLSLGNTVEAEAALARGREFAAQDTRLLAASSDLMISLSRWTDAETRLNELLELVPDSAAHYNNRAYTRYRLGRLDEAEQDARRAVELRPDYAPAHDTLGWILATAGRPRDALPFLREASARMGTDQSVRYHLASVLADLGRNQESLAELYFALENDNLFPEREKAMELQAKLEAM
ncbi:MAG: XrtA/PEP-CTERM system TPR-repeat protein PrsT [Pseudomonadota bacterium]